MKDSLGMSMKLDEYACLDIQHSGRGDENCKSKLEMKMGHNYGVIQDIAVWFNWCVSVCV